MRIRVNDQPTNVKSVAIFNQLTKSAKWRQINADPIKMLNPFTPELKKYILPTF